MGALTATWPDARLDPIRRLHVVAAALPNAGVGEIIVDRPYDEVWPWLMDLERSVPTFDSAVTRIRITDGAVADGRLRLWAWQGRNPVPIPFRVTVEDGWCLMAGRARAFVVLMAAVPLGDGRTRYAHAEAVPIPGTGFLRSRMQQMVDADLRGVGRSLS